MRADTIYAASISDLANARADYLAWAGYDPGVLVQHSPIDQHTFVAPLLPWIKVSAGADIRGPLNIADFHPNGSFNRWVMKQNGLAEIALSPTDSLVAIASSGITLLSRNGDGAETM